MNAINLEKKLMNHSVSEAHIKRVQSFILYYGERAKEDEFYIGRLECWEKRLKFLQDKQKREYGTN